jgi:hypothetical protein
MRELGHRGGKSRRKGVAEQLPESERQSLRESLRDGLDHETIKTAIERSLLGDNESARVACVKFLADLELYRKDDQDEERKADFARAGAEARQYLAKQLDRRARVMKAADVRQVRNVLDEVAAEMRAAAADLHPDLVAGDISVEDAERIFEGLEEIGLIVRSHRLEEYVETRAQERLAALRAEHSLGYVDVKG